MCRRRLRHYDAQHMIRDTVQPIDKPIMKIAITPTIVAATIVIYDVRL